MQEWLKNEDDAPAEAEVWGDKKPSFKNLSDMLDHYESPAKKKVAKEKRKQQVEPSSHSEEEVVKGKGKGKAKAKKARVGSKRKAGPSKSRQNDD
jgi:thiamine pyrophosphate-dependent acetolactate synthase large subunit-like protein